MYAKQCRFKKFVGTRFVSFRFVSFCFVSFGEHIRSACFSFSISFRFLLPSIYIPNLSRFIHIQQEYKNVFQKSLHTVHVAFSSIIT